MVRKNPLIRGVIAGAILGAYYAVVAVTTQPEAPAKRRTVSADQVLAVQSDNLFRDHQYAAALPMLEKLHSEFPDNHIYLSRLATIYQATRQTEKEVQAWEKYMQVAPNPASACPEIGDAYRRLGRMQESVRALERCLAVDGGSDAVFYLARAYEREGEWQKAAQLYRRGVQQSPNYIDLRVGLARAELRTGNLVAAHADMQVALEKSPDNSDALLLAGLIARRLGDVKAARDYFGRGAEVSPNYTDLHRELAKASEQLGDRKTALKTWQHVLELQPNDREATAGVARLQGAGR